MGRPVAFTVTCAESGHFAFGHHGPEKAAKLLPTKRFCSEKTILNYCNHVFHYGIPFALKVTRVNL
ncbi:MAG: hypothetical protein VXV96_00590 [Bdellovibrionota bacterium]|nr:hypothetical protein [Bdellovibrionota bacterium]